MTLPTLTLNDGHSIPALGFGTYPLVGDEGGRAVLSALEHGYRILDSAVNYENEGIVGRALRDFLRESGVPRHEITVQSKLPGRHHSYERAIASGEESRARLGVDRLDVLLIHWPNPITGLYKEAWRALVELRERGVVRTIGVSNFNERLLDDIISDTHVVPAINQVELHPYFPQVDLLERHKELGIVTQAWSPLGKRQAPYGEPVVVAAADRLGVTPAQVILRWHLERGTLPLPKSATPSRQVENLAAAGFSLTADEVDAITALGRPDGRLFDGDPETHEEM
ncbi:aldo/keto reductase [Demequina sp. SYSU T00192]|uniref:Aldo/keto reductase n=1 Tax=Demequina litoralis TaxID=3051660 RepID=A0ABT8GB97_9MICO|nr:aldo/keto reductase [Demequina sp. SYSU T00192]MDN4476420.1 aldo/keto reductase [Demequina sp. SYSU T00192]